MEAIERRPRTMQPEGRYCDYPVGGDGDETDPVCEACGEDYVWAGLGCGSFCVSCYKRNRRLMRVAEHSRGEVRPFYVVCYGVSRAYGGPEEGGWWYDVTEIIEVRKCWDIRQGLRHVRALRKEHPTCRYGRHSAASSQYDQDVTVACYYTPDDFPTEGPFTRPRYE